MYEVSQQSYLASYVPKDWTLIAALDESEPYEVDVTEIWQHEGMFLLVTASGCSCWDGDYDMTQYATLDELEASIRTEDQQRWNPSPRAIDELLSLARA